MYYSVNVCDNMEYRSPLVKSSTRILIIATVLTTLSQNVLSAKSKVLLSDIETLTFRDGVQTNYFRAKPVQQLECIGGSSARYADYKPRALHFQCYNSGFDGQSVQWKCNAELPKNVRFGRLDVNCEGYDYPEDKYVLTGSCALRYELDFKDSQSSHRVVKESMPWLSALVSGSKAYSAYLSIGGLLLMAFAVWHFFLRDINPATNRSVPGVEPVASAYPDSPPNYEEATRNDRPSAGNHPGYPHDTSTRFRAQPSAPMPGLDYGWNVPPRSGTGDVFGSRYTNPNHQSSQWRKSSPPSASSTTTTTTTEPSDNSYGWLAGATAAGAALLGGYLWGSSTSPSHADSVTHRRGVSDRRSVRRRSSSSDRGVYTATGYAGTSGR